MPKLATVTLLVLVISTVEFRGAEGSSENNLQEIAASEILAKIQNGMPVDYDHIIVRGTLDLSKLDLPTKQVSRTHSEKSIWGLSETSRVVSSHIRIINSTLDGFVDFNNTFFSEPIDFIGSNFTKDANF
jgi:hypothetical protein